MSSFNSCQLHVLCRVAGCAVPNRDAQCWGISDWATPRGPRSKVLWFSPSERLFERLYEWWWLPYATRYHNLWGFGPKNVSWSQMSQHLGGSPGKGEARRLFSMGLQGCRGASNMLGLDLLRIYHIRSIELRRVMKAHQDTPGYTRLVCVWWCFAWLWHSFGQERGCSTNLILIIQYAVQAKENDSKIL